MVPRAPKIDLNGKFALLVFLRVLKACVRKTLHSRLKFNIPAVELNPQSTFSFILLGIRSIEEYHTAPWTPKVVFTAPLS